MLYEVITHHERVDDLLRHLLLDFEDVRQRSLVAVRPDLVGVVDVDQFDGDPDIVLKLPHASGEDIPGPQLSPDRLDVLLRPLVLHGRGPRYDADLVEPGEVRDEFLCQAVPEVFVFFLGADVFSYNFV